MPRRSRAHPRRLARFLAAASLSLLAAAPAARGLNIVLQYNAAASNEPAGDPIGTLLTSQMQYVESVYEDIFETAHTITITYWYEELGGSTLAAHSLSSQSGGRETAGTIRFSPSGAGFGWFWDPTPADNSEYNMTRTLWRNLSAPQKTAAFNFGADIPQTFEVGFTGPNNGSNPAVNGRIDMLATAFHETGHALGMSAANTSTISQTGDGDYDFTPSSVFGKTLAARHFNSSISHLASLSTLMFPTVTTDARQLPSHTDLLSMAAGHSYTLLDIPRREFYGGTDWNIGANWTGNVAPGATDDAFVRRSGPANEPRDVTLSANGVAGVLTVAEQSAVHTSNRLLAINTGIVDAATIFVEASGSLTSNALTIQNAGVLQIDGGSANISGALRILAATTVTFDSGALSCATLEVSDGRLLVTSGADKVVRAGAVSVTPDGRIDLTNNKAIVDYGVADPSPLPTIQQLILSGYDGGAWNADGITTSSGDATHALGYADNSVLGLSSFGGQSVDLSSVLIKFTYFGDADLNGQVDVADLGSLASHWQTNGVWTDGDFDYNGTVNVNDLGLLASNWQAGVGGPLAPTDGHPWALAEALHALGLPPVAVPEPASLMLVAASLPLLAARQRRRRQCLSCLSTHLRTSNVPFRSTGL